MNTTKLVYITFAFGMAASSGCGTDVSATASGVFPAQGFSGRSLRVEISGDQTKWKDGATVSFGDGVTVNTVTVASPTDLFADITIDPKAASGMRDVTVTSGGAFKLTQAFEVDAPVDLAFTGNTAQGSGPKFTITNHDVENPFDTTSDGQGGFPNIQINGPAGVTFSISSVTEHAISGFALIDVDASTGGAVSVVSGPAGGMQVTSNPTTTMTIDQRQATALTSGTAASGNLAMPYYTDLYSVTIASAPELMTFAIPQPSDQAAQPIVLLLGPSGHWADAITSNFNPFLGALPSLNQLSLQAGTYYVLYFDAGSEGGYSYSLKETSSTFTSAAEGNDTSNNAEATAQAGGTLPFLLTTATLSSSTDQDWIKFTNGVVGKSVHVVTYGDTLTDTAVDVLDGTACANDLMGGSAQDLGNQEDALSSALTSTTFCVQITTGSAFSASHNAYQAAIWLE